MSFKVNFMANQTVTDEDINAIGYNLANTVYTSFKNDVTYGIDALNDITKNIVGKGIKREYGNMCAVSLDGTTVTIQSGLAFFENGSTMTIDEEGISLELEDATLTNYVYLFHNTALNIAGARCTTEIPSGLDVILLATITNGIVTMDRTYATSKLDNIGTPQVDTYTLDGIYEDGWTKYRTDFNVMGYSKVYFRPQFNEDINSYGSVVAFGVYDIQNQILEFAFVGHKKYTWDFVGCTVYDATSVCIEDGELVLNFYPDHNWHVPSNRKLVLEFYGVESEVEG